MELLRRNRRLGRRQSGLVLAALAAWLLLGAAQAQMRRPFPEVGPGLEFTMHRIGDVPWASYVVKVDRSRADFAYASTLAKGTIFGLQPVRGQVADLPADRGKPVAAVNGDFFWIREGAYQGDPTGLQIVNGELVSAPIGASFWVGPSGQPHIGEVTSQMRVVWPDDTSTPFGLNQERKDNTVMLYTPTLGPSTRTVGGCELVLEQVEGEAWLPIKPGQRYSAKVREIREQGDTPLTPDTMILSLGPELLAKLPAVKQGDVVRLATATSPDLTGVQAAIGGGPVLVTKGEARQWDPPGPRHPRTALGWDNKSLYLVVVDGRQTDLSAGMTFPELASLMRSLGCTEAMNLDGGGSSTLWLGGQVVNSPSDGRERSVANALVVLRK